MDQTTLLCILVQDAWIHILALLMRDKRNWDSPRSQSLRSYRLT